MEGSRGVGVLQRGVMEGILDVGFEVVRGETVVAVVAVVTVGGVGGVGGVVLAKKDGMGDAFELVRGNGREALGRHLVDASAAGHQTR